MRIAVIGAGISGMGAAYALSEDHDVTLFEKEDRFGGHANTVEVDGTAVDTGFIVYNYDNYPNLTGLFDHLDVPTKWSDMSFGMSINNGRTEYACDDIWKMFAQPSNLLRPSFLKGVREILRFHKEAEIDLHAGALTGLTLGQYLDARGYGTWIRDCFLLPMGGAIWSTPTGDVLDFPAENFVAFFANHELLNGASPGKRWRTVDGGSREYVQRLTSRLAGAHCKAAVRSIRRVGGRPILLLEDGSEHSFDQVVLATHAPQALGMLDADAQEREILGAFKTSQNLAVLHSDARLMPKRKTVWSSWNFLSDGGQADAARPAPITYWMNRLQTLDQKQQLFVSLNPEVMPAGDKLHGQFSYAHPLFTQEAFDGQRAIDAIQGRGGVWYAGAWLGYGFHEDGLRSGLRVAAALGSVPAWRGEEAVPIGSPMTLAAE